jgi:hypothetical protein
MRTTNIIKIIGVSAFLFAAMIFARVPLAHAACTDWAGAGTVANQCLDVSLDVFSQTQNGSCQIYGSGCSGGSSFVIVDPQFVNVLTGGTAEGGKGESEGLTFTTLVAAQQAESCSDLQIQGCGVRVGTQGRYNASFSVDTSKYAPGNYVATLNVPGAELTPFSFPFKVTAGGGGGGGSVGTIDVSSRNSVDNSLLSSSWDFQSAVDPCDKASCSGTGKTYTSQPTGNYILIPGAAPAGYSFDTAVITPIASHNSFVSHMLALGKEFLIPTAWAVQISPASSLVLTDGDTISFTIKWDPEAAITVNPTSLSGSGSFTITNSGKPGSKLNWTAKSDNGCATISAPSGNNVGQGSSNTENVTVSGACSAKITVSGISQPSGNAVPSKIVTISVAGPVGPSVNLTANPGTINLYGSTILTWTVANATGCTASASPAENDWNGSKSSTGGSQSAIPLVQGNETYTLTCTGPGGSQSDTATVKVNPGPLPKCSIDANPTTITLPETSTVTYNCTNLQSQDVCSFTASDKSGPYTVQRTTTTAKYGQPVSPTQATTKYTISCQDPNNANYSASATVSVSVTNPHLTECPPQGCTP